MRMTKPATIAGILVMASMMGSVAQAASDRVTVPLPDTSGLSRQEGQAMLAELANVNVITSNCPGYQISDGEWMLITGTGDKLAAQLGLDPTSYDRSFYGPAFKLLDDPGACDRIGPQARPLIERLIDMGGRAEVVR